MTPDKIKEICEEIGLFFYSINSDMSVDVDNSLYLDNRGFSKLPLNFGKVPENFHCQINYLTDLNGCPKYVGGDFNCQDNRISSLKDLPINFYIGGNFRCFENNITSPTEYSKLFFGYIGGEIWTDCGYLDKFLNKHKNPHKKDLPKILSELRKIKL